MKNAQVATESAVTLAGIDLLLAEQDCRDLVVEAAVLIDAQSYERFAALFIENGVLVRPGAEPLLGRAAIIESYRSRPHGRITRHLISNSLVTLESDTAAHGTSYVQLWSGMSSDIPGPFGRPAQTRQVIGEFVDYFTLTVEGWRFSRREASFTLFREDGERGI
ncbi:hypothetical protein GTP46_27050 [Duganella sp. FT135W]|uniref:SnoaL-like domain-containing protein n=1 Tax=Duganella flavida TaxID=2692175 RepID=A0A6L8KKP2_9BURK|nr:nuclear transport factor 2 family protein [Duganella flavida]MYM26294.1 hypothetical protein [Duganella flavida]